MMKQSAWVLIAVGGLVLAGCDAVKDLKTEAIQAGREQINRNMSDAVNTSRNQVRETLVPADDPDEFEKQIGSEKESDDLEE